MNRLDRGLRLLFWLTVAFAASTVWLLNYPPMTDLPQNAGHIALLRDYWLGQSPWTNLIYANYFTPYLFGYSIAVVLSFFMPVLMAMKIMMSAAFLTYVDVGIRLRKHFQVDARLDWLLIPAFFGHAWHWGFFTFLIAAPLCLWFILFSARYAHAPTVKRGISLSLFGTVLFFTHGFVFGFAAAIGGLMLLCSQPLKRIFIYALPWLPLFMLSIAYVYLSQDMITAHESNIAYGNLWIRLLQFPSFIVSGISSPAIFFLGVALLVLPFLLSLQIAKDNRAAFIPLLVLGISWFLLPHRFADLVMLYQRLAIFSLPFVMLIFAGSVQQKTFRPLPYIMLVATCLACVGLTVQYINNEAGHEKDFMTIMAAAEPDERAIELTFDDGNDTSDNYELFYHTAQWYQVEKQGLVDFNFLTCTAVIMHYKPGNSLVQNTYQSVEAGKFFNWNSYGMSRYKYIFARHTAPLPAQTFANNQCNVSLVKEAGDWSLYSIDQCK